MEFRVESHEAVESTNNLVKQAIENGEPEGFAVRASRQTGGYGRQGRTWASPEGGLYMSLLLRPATPPAQLPTLSLAAGVAVCRAVAPIVPHAQVKWPNDVVAYCSARPEGRFRKLCGISVEAHRGGVCVGIGLNVVAPAVRPCVGGRNEPAYLSDFAPQLAARPAAAVDDACSAVLAAFSDVYETWCVCGFSTFVDEFNAHAALTGRTVTIADRGGVPTCRGVVESVDDLGRLRVRDSGGTLHSVTTGEAHLK